YEGRHRSPEQGHRHNEQRGWLLPRSRWLKQWWAWDRIWVCLSKLQQILIISLIREEFPGNFRKRQADHRLDEWAAAGPFNLLLAQRLDSILQSGKPV